MPAFDLDTAARHGTAPVRILACYLTMAVRDGADRLALDPALISASWGGAWYFVADVRYDLVPPPDAVFRKLIPLLRDLVSRTGDRFPTRLGGQEFDVQVEIAPVPGTGDRATLRVPLVPALSQPANDLFCLNVGPDGAISFDDAELV